MNRSKKAPSWKPFIRYYTGFRIPWLLFIISFLSGIVYTEAGILVTKYTIMLNTGELYNRAIIGYVVFSLLLSLISILTNMTNDYGEGIITVRARAIIYEKILRMPPREFEKESPSAYISRVSADAAQASASIRTLSNVITSVYSFVRYYLELFRYSDVLTLWLLIAVPLAVATFVIVGWTQYLAYERIYGAINTMTGFFSEHLASVKHFKAQTMEERERQEGFRAIEKRFQADVFNAFIVAAQVFTHSVYENCCKLILVFSGRTLINSGKMDSNGLLVGDTYLTNVQQYLAELLMEWETFKSVQAVLGKSVEIMDQPSEQMEGCTALPEEIRDLQIEELAFSYREEQEVLHKLSFTIPGGKKTAIVGDNGCGKSTLFKLLMRFYQPDSGCIRYGETPLEELSLDQWRGSIGYVLQNAPLLSGSIRENILYGMQGEVTEEELIAAAKAADAYDFIMEFPEGFEKEVGEGGMHLSGGQRQRIAIARALITDPKILLMDEATASLDVQSDRQVWEACERLMEGRTTILIAHDMNAVMSADQVVVLNHGSLEAVGVHETLMQNSPTYQAYVRLHSGKEGAV